MFYQTKERLREVREAKTKKEAEKKAKLDYFNSKSER